MNIFKIPFWVLVLLFTQNVAAKTVKYVELGINRSTFRNESCTPGYGISGGLGIDYYPWQKFGGFWGWGLGIQNKKMDIKDRTLPSAAPPATPSFVSIKDFDINITFIEIPIKLGYSIDVGKHITLTFLSGYAISVPLNDNTTSNPKRSREIAPEEKENLEFDYVQKDETHVTSSNYLLVGTSIAYRNMSISIDYLSARTATENIVNTSLGDKIDSIKISFAFLF